MQYRTFDNFQRGFSHEKAGSDSACEDYADSYADAGGRFYICAVCDGHSDNNCFRSSKGAQYGCEAAVEILSRFCTLYYEDEEAARKIEFTDEVMLRLKKSIKQYWDDRVLGDINAHPISDEETAHLSDRVRTLYSSGRGLQNIYGATFLAFAISKEFCVALHIGDGIMLCVDSDGTYYEPLQPDKKSETGAPASLCDTDLFSREGAFRCKVLRRIPQAVVVSSDGIGDCMDPLQFMELFHSLIETFESMEQNNSGQNLMNDSQKNYLESLVKHYAQKGNGVEDDCSLAGIYAVDGRIPQGKIPLDKAEQLWRNSIEERNSVIQDYERRKKETIERIDHQKRNMDAETSVWYTDKGKLENHKEALRNIVRNEEDKNRYYDARIRGCEEYIQRAGGAVPGRIGLIRIMPVDERYLEEDEVYKEIKEYMESRNAKGQEKKLENVTCNGEAYRDVVQTGETEAETDPKDVRKEYMTV